LIELKRFEEALVACNRGIEINQNEPLLWKNKALIFEKIGQPEEAEKCRERAQALGERTPDKGFRAEIKIEDKYDLILLAKETPTGPTTSIYDAKVKQWCKKAESASSIEDAMRKAEEFTQALYKRVVRGGQPLQFEWKPTTFPVQIQRGWWAEAGINGSEKSSE
jgi:tetratricopeptide (TPR) repeat protein